MRARPALLLPPIVAVLLVGLTACSGSPAGAASSSAAPATATKAAASASAAPSVHGPVDACTLLPAATASKIMGLTYVTAETRSQGGDTSECDYDTKGISLDHLTLEVQLTGGKDESSDDQQVIVFEGKKPIVLTGLGDSAYEAPEGSDARIEKAFGALWGDTYITVGGPVHISEAQARSLITATHDAL